MRIDRTVISALRPATAVSHNPPQLVVKPGLFRYEVAGHGKTVVDVFAALQKHRRFIPIAASANRMLPAGRLALDRAEGYGGWEFYLINPDVFLITNELVFNAPRVETVPGEGLIAFHLRLSGRLDLELPGLNSPISVEGPRLQIWSQAPGASVTECVGSGTRESTITLYCSVRYLRSLSERFGMINSPLIEEIERGAESSVWHQELDMPAGLLQVGTQLLCNSYDGALRLLHAEAKALEMLCTIFQMYGAKSGTRTKRVINETECTRLNKARELLQRELSQTLRMVSVARAVGMSESTLKRGFRTKFGVSVFEFRLDCRMRCALDLLHVNRMPVGEVARTVGYQHLSSFSSAFSAHFGYHPRAARSDSGPTAKLVGPNE